MKNLLKGTSYWLKSRYAYCYINSYVDTENKYDFSFFSEEDYNYYINSSNINRKKEIYFGRLAINECLKIYQSNAKKENIKINYGIFHYPLIDISDVEISLSHTYNSVIAIAFPRELLMGIDIEIFSYRNLNVIRKNISSSEQRLLTFQKNSEINRYLLILWTSKEALSKALKIGFTANTEIFEIADVSFHSEYYITRFKNFPLFIGKSYILSEKVITVVGSISNRHENV